jgi:hypothetical protein
MARTECEWRQIIKAHEGKLAGLALDSESDRTSLAVALARMDAAEAMAEYLTACAETLREGSATVAETAVALRWRYP